MPPAPTDQDLARLHGRRPLQRLLARACARLRAPSGYVTVLLGDRAVVVGELGLPEGFPRAEPWEGSLLQWVAAVQAPLAVSDAAAGSTFDAAVSGTCVPTMRAFVAAPFGHGRGALVVWDRRARDIEPAALVCLQELAAGLDALLAEEAGP